MPPTITQSNCKLRMDVLGVYYQYSKLSIIKTFSIKYTCERSLKSEANRIRCTCTCESSLSLIFS
jgi:hypothetical protein